jgi:hypothetical protein
MKRSGYIFTALLCLLAFAGAAFAQPPPVPMNLAARVTNQIPPGIELTWLVPPVMPPVQPTLYKVYRSIDDSSSFSLLNVTNKTGYVDWQVFPGHLYVYYVTTIWVLPDSSVLESPRSNLASATLTPPPGSRTGEITGTVTDSVTGKPIPFARVSFFRMLRPSAFMPQAFADSAGMYRAVLDTGTYLVNCQAPAWMAMMMSMLPPYKTEWYKDASSPQAATPVTVADSSVTTIDFNLIRFAPPPMVHLRGTVRDSAGVPLKGAFVGFTRTAQEMIPGFAVAGDLSNIAGEAFMVDGVGCVRGLLWRGRTDSTGQFDAVLPGGGRSYLAMAVAPGFMPQYFDHKNSPVEATVITPAGDVSGIDFNLNPFRPPQLYTLGGVVRDSAGVRVPSRIIVFPVRPRRAGSFVRFAFTDSLGAYTVPKVTAGSYLVLAIPFGKYGPAFYKNGAYGVMQWKQADTVVVAGDMTGIDIGVVQVVSTGIAHLGGVVRSGNLPLEGALVVAVNADGAEAGYGMTDGTGAYGIDGLGAGTLRIVVDLEGYNTAQQTIGVAGTDFSLSQDFTLGVTTSVVDRSTAPQSYALSQNYPNPFNPGTQIRFVLPVAGSVTLKVFNLLGQEVATLVSGTLAQGSHDAAWNGRDAAGRAVASGVYFYRLEARGANGATAFEAMRKMVLLK